MKQYIDFLEKYSVDKTFYCRTLDDINKEEWEIHWNHQANRDKPWGLKKKSTSSWEWYTSTQLVLIAEQYHLQTDTVERELIGNIKSMIVLNNLMVTDAKKILGNNVVSDAMDEFKGFTEVLIKSMQMFLPSTESSTKRSTKVFLKLVSHNKNL